MPENFYPAYKECPECGKVSKNNKAYFECKDKSNCGFIEKQWLRVSKTEKVIRKKVEEMIGYLLKGNLPRIKFVGESEIVGFGEMAVICAGWYFPPFHTLSIPRKTLYLPRKEIVDVTAHESGHVTSWEEDEKNKEINYTKGWTDSKHGPAWYGDYIENYNQLTSKYSDWINESHKTRFTLGEEIPNPMSDYRINPEDIKFDPYED